MTWTWRQGKRLAYLTIPEWEAEGIQIGFSSRWGGVSHCPYSSLNLGLHVGDEAEQVRINRGLWFQEWDTQGSDVAIGEQVHGAKIHRVIEADRGRGSDSLDTVLTGVDGLITTTHTALMAFYADCVPVFFYHPELKTIGIAHAGWKGTSGKIVTKVCEELGSLGGDIGNCWAAIGPSIGPCCYEVDEKVINEFHKNFSATPFLKPTKPGHAVLDLKVANQMLLSEAGIPRSQIWVAQECTACHTDSFFSHRREGPMTGRMAGWIRRLPREEA